MRRSSVPPIASIRSVDAVVRLRSVTAAARELQISQPAVTQALSRLADDFGAPLFLDGGDGPQATETALALSGLYRSFKSQFDTIKTRAEVRNGGGIELRISAALTRVLSGHLLPRAAAAFRIEQILSCDDLLPPQENQVMIARHRQAVAPPQGVVETRPEWVQLVSFRGQISLDEISFADAIYVPQQWLDDWRAFNRDMNDEINARVVVVDDPATAATLAAMAPALCLLDVRFGPLLNPHRKHHVVSRAEFSTEWCFSVVAGCNFEQEEVRRVFCAWLVD